MIVSFSFFKRSSGLFLGALLLQLYSLSAQETQTWKAVFTDLSLDSVSSLRLETHYRMFDFFGERAQLIIRPSYTKKINKFVSLSGGYTYLANTKAAAVLDEHNIWEQLFFSIPHHKLNFFGWLRVEQRLMEQPTQEFKYGARSRFRIGLSHHLVSLKSGSLDFMTFNEVFLISQNTFPKTFDQNWTFIGLKIPIGAKAHLVSGYQRISAGNGLNAVEKNLWSSILFVHL